MIERGRGGRERRPPRPPIIAHERRLSMRMAIFCAAVFAAAFAVFRYDRHKRGR